MCHKLIILILRNGVPSEKSRFVKIVLQFSLTSPQSKKPKKKHLHEVISLGPISQVLGLCGKKKRLITLWFSGKNSLQSISVVDN